MATPSSVNTNVPPVSASRAPRNSVSTISPGIRKRFTFRHEERIPSRIKQLLEIDKSFAGSDQYHILDLHDRKWTSHTVKNLEAEMKSWPLNKGHTKVILVPGHDQKESTFPVTQAQPTSCYPINIPRAAFKTLMNLTGVPLIYAGILFQHNARCFPFTNGKRSGFILHMRNPGFSYSVSYPEQNATERDMEYTACSEGFEEDEEEKEDNTTYAVIQGLKMQHIKIMVQEIQEFCPDAWAPAMIAAALLELMGGWTNGDSSRIYQKLRKTETELETKTDNLLQRPSREKYWFEAKDLDPLARDLTIIATSLGRIDHQCLYGTEMIKVVEKVNKDTHFCSQNDGLATRLADLHSWFEVLRSEGKFYMTRTEANRSTVFNLIQQQDNLINFAMSRTNLLESNAMKVLAKATAKDSSQMLFFSIITFILLPATFTGTFFSTTFFSFQAEGWTYDPHLYVYFLTTIPLTLVIAASWFIFMRIKMPMLEKQLEHLEDTNAVLSQPIKGLEKIVPPKVG